MIIHKSAYPAYTISIVSEILECHPRTLRIYEAEGFVKPKRKNNIRYYSEDDVVELRKLIEMMEKWSLNIPGVHALFEAADRFGIKASDMIEAMLE